MTAIRPGNATAVPDPAEPRAVAAVHPGNPTAVPDPVEPREVR
ncbi:hypothetical protein [Streptomyces sp. NPDC057554]